MFKLINMFKMYFHYTIDRGIIRTYSYVKPKFVEFNIM